MTTNRRRTATLPLAVAAIALTTGLLTACDPTDTSDASNSLNCLRNWNTISDSLKAIHDAGVDAAKDPTRTDESIATINKNIDKIDANSDDSKVDKAVDNLNKAISDYNKSILNGDTNPDSSKIDAAADKLKNVCTS
ncbi:hypothetical protein AB0I69_06360 [Streptomyces sp. NPDC050508]|uniref:hypothetical protein n=1 Tax=Streptomyces sp. NPDC050508 TaxID=3155405 RepID=UPI003446FE3F